MPGEPLFRADLPSGQEPAAGDEPAGAGEGGERDQRAAGPRDGVQGRRPPVAASPEADPAEDEEDRADPGPEAEAAAVAAQRRRDADPPSAAAREEVDGRRQEGQQHGDEHDLDRPAANQPLPEEDVARRALCERDAALHRVHRVLRSEADRPEMLDIELRAAPRRSGRPRAGRRHGHGRDAAAHERRLLVRVEGKPEAHELLETAGPRRLAVTLLRERRAQCLDEARRR